MQGMGLMEAHAGMTGGAVSAEPGAGKGVKIVILGAGIAGLVSAYELRALGYECTLLECRQRPGGRNWTVRGGDRVTFLDGTTQTCTWDKGNYQNFGPARLPSVHKTMLGYCEKLGVPLEVEVNMTRSAFLQNDKANGGKPVLLRQAENDTRGHVSELLEKAVNQGLLEQDISKEDRQRMLDFLRTYGPLDDTGKYVGSDRAGYSKTAGAGDQTGVLSAPIDMHTLLDENFWQYMLFDEQFDMQATMFQPVGGMDRIPYAFAKALGDVVKYDAPVTEIRKTSKGVKVGYTSHGSAKTIEADYCICAMPLTILKRTPNDFSAPYKKVIDECSYASAYKIAWESRRFWEQDFNIYGGLENVATGPNPVWLPSGGLFSDRGVLVSGYAFETEGAFQKLSLAEKFAASRRTVERLHPGYGKELENPIYVPWIRVPFNQGSWIASYGPHQDAYTDNVIDPGYEQLLQPDGPIYFVGEHVSHIRAWQEGAALSALRAVRMIGQRERAKKA
jgi:monoamine oxidase